MSVEITRTAADNTIARIIHMVEEAQASKAPTARFIDDFSRWYTPAAMLVAAAVVLAPPLALGGEWSTWIYRGLAVLLVACPCALVISMPAAIASGFRLPAWPAAPRAASWSRGTGPRNPGQGQDRCVRQDRHPHSWKTGSDRCRRLRRCRRRHARESGGGGGTVQPSIGYRNHR